MSITKEKIKILLDKVSETEAWALMLVMEELTKSKEKHPGFADGSLTLTLAASIVSEECGEMCREVNRFVQEDGGTTSKIMVEAAHTAVTAIRLIEMVDKMSTDVNNPDTFPYNDYKTALRIIDNMMRDGEDHFDILTKMNLLFELKKRV